jgi:hypothetical protein
MTNRIEEMRAQIHATPMAPVLDRGGWRRRQRIGLVSGGAVGVAIAAVAAIVAVSHLWHGQPVVTITLREEQDIPKLNAQLKAAHVRVRVVPIIRGCHDPVHQLAVGSRKVAPGPPKTMLAFAEYYGREQLYVSQETIGTKIRPGLTYIVPDSKTGFLQGGGGFVVGKVPTCAGIGRPLKVGRVKRWNVKPKG